VFVRWGQCYVKLLCKQRRTVAGYGVFTATAHQLYNYASAGVFTATAHQLYNYASAGVFVYNFAISVVLLQLGYP
jgi:hypothetical protein